MAHINKLINGYKRFYKDQFLGQKSKFEKLANEGQSPKTLIIGCSDSRVDPSILTDCGTGDIFVVRNVANLVPPYNPKNDSYHGTSAALEFAVNNVGVEHIVVLGHSGCAGIKALVDDDDNEDEFSFVKNWVKIGKKSKAKALQRAKIENEDKYTICEKEGIRTSIENLMTFPWVKQRIESNLLKIHGWYFSIVDCKLKIYDNKIDKFINVIDE